MKSENSMLLFLGVHCTFVLVVTSCGIDTILAAEKLRLFNLDAEKCLLILNGSVSLVTNI